MTGSVNPNDEVDQLLDAITRVQAQLHESEEQVALTRAQNSELHDRALQLADVERAVVAQAEHNEQRAVAQTSGDAVYITS